jgi:hypothetical protein
MPTYHNVNYSGVALFVRPIGWRKWLRFYPYSQGDKVRFRIGLKDKTKHSPLGRIAVYEDIPLPEKSQKERYPQLIDYYLEAQGGTMPEELDLTGSVISVAGQCRYTINHPTSQEAIEIITFDAKRDSTMFMWLTPTIAAIVATIISVILWLFFPPKLP